MQKITFEDYKKAIRAKFEIEKDGVYFNFLTPPSQANLRKLCWERFNSNNSVDDLSIFSFFFEFEFDPEKKNHFRDQTDRFRPIGSFLKNEKDPANQYAVELAAILVDFQPRPFKKYKERGIIIPENLIEGPKIPFAFGFKKNDESENDEDGNDKIEDEKEIEKENKLKNSLIAGYQSNFSGNTTNKLRVNSKKLKSVIIGIIIVFGLGFIISRYAFPKKQCMQWSGDHYEKVDCDLNVNGLIPSTIEPFDEIKFELKKVNVCDSTTCFKNGKSIIWYAKTGDNQADFFNTHGIHPENGKALRPVTEYIRGKYKKKDCTSK
jgi:hypothetical protein